MIALLLMILCSTSIVLILKKNEIGQGEISVLLFGNYLIAAAISAIFLFSYPEATISLPAVGFGVLMGILFVAGFVVFARALAAAGTALATISSRLSVAVPITLAILIFGERPDGEQLLGFFFTALTFFLFYRSLTNSAGTALKRQDWLLLLVVFSLFGINDFCFKLFQQWRPVSEKPAFLLAIFGSAALYTGAFIGWSAVAVRRSTIRLGCILGIPNVFSSYFLLAALKTLPATVVFPVANIGIILLSSMAAFLFWREKLNRHALSALGTGTLAIAFLA